MSKQSVEREAVSDFGILRGGKSGPFGRRWRLRTLKTRLAIALGGREGYVVGRAGVHNGNSGLTAQTGLPFPEFATTLLLRLWRPDKFDRYPETLVVLPPDEHSDVNSARPEMQDVIAVGVDGEPVVSINIFAVRCEAGE